MKPDVFRQHGRPRTVQRELILQILADCSGHVAQNDIYERVHAQLPMVNRSTVSRTLDALEEMGMVRHVHNGAGAVRYHRAEDPLHLHLVCRSCGETIDVADVAIGIALDQLLRERFTFIADLTHFPITGTCSSCSKEPPPHRHL